MVLKTTFTILVTILNIELVVTSICCQSNRMLEPDAPNIDIPHLNGSPSAEQMSRVTVTFGQDHCGIESGVVAGLPKL